MVAKWAGARRVLTLGGLLDLEVALSTDGGVAALYHVDLCVVEEADGAFLVAVSFSGLSSIKAGS